MEKVIDEAHKGSCIFIVDKLQAMHYVLDVLWNT